MYTRCWISKLSLSEVQIITKTSDTSQDYWQRWMKPGQTYLGKGGFQFLPPPRIECSRYTIFTKQVSASFHCPQTLISMLCLINLEHWVQVRKSTWAAYILRGFTDPPHTCSWPSSFETEVLFISASSNRRNFHLFSNVCVPCKFHNHHEMTGLVSFIRQLCNWNTERLNNCSERLNNTVNDKDSVQAQDVWL